MAQQNVVEAARRGKPGAISAWLNRALKPHSVLAKAALKDYCLQILLEAPQVPSPNLVTLIQQRLTSLESLVIHQVKVYGQELGSDRPQWMREFEIASNTSVTFDSKEKETLSASNQVNRVANSDTNQVSIKSDRGHQPQQPEQSKVQESIQQFGGNFVPPGHGYDKFPIKIAGPGQGQLTNQGLEVRAFKQGNFVGFKPTLGGLIGSSIVCFFLYGAYFFLYQVGIIQTSNLFFLIVAPLASIVFGVSLANGDNYQKDKKIDIFFPWNVVEHAKLLKNSYFLLNDKTERSSVVTLRIKQFRHNKILYDGDLYFKPDTEVLMFLEALRKQGVTVFGMEREMRESLKLKAPIKNTTSSWLTSIIQKPSTGIVALLVVIAFIAFIFFGAFSSPKPQEFKSEAGAFSVVAPATLKAEVQSKDLPSAFGKIDVYIFTGNRGNIHYMVAYNDFPGELMKRLSSDTSTILYKGRSSGIESINGELVSSSNIVLGSHSGIEFVADAEAGYGRYIRLKQRVYLVDKRLYQVAFIAPRFGFNDKEAMRYLNSFKLLSK